MFLGPSLFILQCCTAVSSLLVVAGLPVAGFASVLFFFSNFCHLKTLIFVLLPVTRQVLCLHPQILLSVCKYCCHPGKSPFPANVFGAQCGTKT